MTAHNIGFVFIFGKIVVTTHSDTTISTHDRGIPLQYVVVRYIFQTLTKELSVTTTLAILLTIRMM